MTSKQHNNNLNAHTNPRENFKKNFFWKNFEKRLPKVCLYPRRGLPPNTFYLWKFRAPKKPLSAIFSVFVLFYVLFRNTVLAIPIVYKILSLLGLIRFCTIICIFSDYVPAGVDFSILLYRGTRARIGIVPILSLFCLFSEIWYKKRNLCIIVEKK